MAKVPVPRSQWKIDPAELAVAQERTEARLADLFSHRATVRHTGPRPPIIVDGVELIGAPDELPLPAAAADQLSLVADAGHGTPEPPVDLVGVFDASPAPLIPVMDPHVAAVDLLVPAVDLRRSASRTPELVAVMDASVAPTRDLPDLVAAVPELADPDSVAPELVAVPELAEPDSVAPELVAVPELADPDAVAPEPAVPELAEPDSVAPELVAVPELADPDAVAPEPAVPELADRDSVAPELVAVPELAGLSEPAPPEPLQQPEPAVPDPAVPDPLVLALNDPLGPAAILSPEEAPEPAATAELGVDEPTVTEPAPVEAVPDAARPTGLDADDLDSGQPTSVPPPWARKSTARKASADPPKARPVTAKVPAAKAKAPAAKAKAPAATAKARPVPANAPAAPGNAEALKSKAPPVKANALAAMGMASAAKAAPPAASVVRPKATPRAVSATPPAIPILGAALCPYCARLLQPPPTASRHCPRCRQQIVVKRVEGHMAYLTEAAVAVFEAERRKEADAERLSRDRERWLKLAGSAGAPAGSIRRIATTHASPEVVDAARALYTTAVDRSFQSAKRGRRWEDAAKVRRDHAAALHRMAGSPKPPTDEAVAVHREGVAAELRGLAEIVRDAELVSDDCCETCRVDDRRIVTISKELATPSLPHQGCPRGLCRCGWDLATRDREAVLRYLRRRPRPATHADSARQAPKP